ncbi:hypothetical protein [Streptomyces sp. NPDC001089]
MSTAEFPPGVLTARLTGHYTSPDGTPLQGSVTFTPPVILKLPGQDTFTAARTAVTLKDGAFDVTLLANDTPGMSPFGWAYQVTERLVGVPIRVYYILLPHLPSRVDLSDLAPSSPYEGYWLPAFGPKGDKGDKGDPGDVSRAELDAVAAAAGLKPQTFFQSLPSTAWVIDHTLPYRPAVMAFDASGCEIGGSVEYPTPTSVTVRFAYAEAGSAVLH